MKITDRTGRRRVRIPVADSGSTRPRTRWRRAWHGLGLLMPILGVLALLAATGVIAANYDLSAEDQCGVTTSSPSASSAELCITSPPDNSIIAISNPNFVSGADIGPNDRAPDLSMLKLKVSGTSTCSGNVTVNGFAANPPTGNWSVEIPIIALATGGVGQVTLTAKAAGCDDATNTVTLINLYITKPADQQGGDDDSLAITTEPAMPDLNATLSILGYTGDASGVTFYWTLDVRGEQVSRRGDWSHPYSSMTTGFTTGPGEAWQPTYNQIVGGVGRLSVMASLPGVTGNPVTSFPVWINIPGSNPGKAAVISYINDPNAKTISQIFCVESRWQQFNPDDTNGDPPHPPQPPIPNVPADWAPNPGALQPYYGWPAGIGVAQLDPETGTSPLADYWNWQTNVTDGVALFNEKLAEAPGLVTEEQERLTDRRNAAIAIARANRSKNNTPGTLTPPPLLTVPPLTDLEILWEAVKLYNTDVYAEFHFNADYIVSANGLNVLLVATDTSLPMGWVGAADLPGIFPGVPASGAGSWGGMGNHKKAMRWIPEHDENWNYDGQVQVCPAKPGS